MIIFNKLVRDKIPEIIRKDNKECKIEILNDKIYEEELKKKLVEEVEEYQSASSDEEALEELADILELIHSLSRTHGANIDKVEEIRRDKANERGGFNEKVFLVGVYKQ